MMKETRFSFYRHVFDIFVFIKSLMFLLINLSLGHNCVSHFHICIPLTVTLMKIMKKNTWREVDEKLGRYAFEKFRKELSSFL